MTPETYYDVCEQMGTTPVDEDVPPELEDFPIEVGLAWTVYNQLPSKFDSFAGVFIGKDYSIFLDILKIFSITDDIVEIFRLTQIIGAIDLEERQRTAASKRSK